MLFFAQKHGIGILLAVSLIALFLGGGLCATDGGEFSQAQAKESAENLQTLLLQLKQRVESERGFSVMIQFNMPLVGDEDTWIIGLWEEGEPLRAFSQVGSDYVCFDESRGGARFERCTPLTNIVGVSYLVE